MPSTSYATRPDGHAETPVDVAATPSARPTLGVRFAAWMRARAHAYVVSHESHFGSKVDDAALRHVIASRLNHH